MKDKKMIKKLILNEDGYGTIEMLIILAGVAAVAGSVIGSVKTSMVTSGNGVKNHVEGLLGEQWGSTP